MLHKVSLCFYKSGSGSVGARSILLWARELRHLSPGFRWNTEAVDNNSLISWKQRNSYQSNATTSIPYAVMYIGKVLDFVKGKIELKTFVEQGSRGLQGVFGKAYWRVGNFNVSSWEQLSPSYLKVNKLQDKALWILDMLLYGALASLYSAATDATFTVYLTSTHFNCSVCSVAGSCQY